MPHISPSSQQPTASYSPATSRAQCTSDKRQRMLDVIRAYTIKLMKGRTESIPASFLQPSTTPTPPSGCDETDNANPTAAPTQPLSADAARTIAIALARDAFAMPRKYYFDAKDNVPTHCLHLDLITTEMFGRSCDGSDAVGTTVTGEAGSKRDRDPVPTGDNKNNDTTNKQNDPASKADDDNATIPSSAPPSFLIQNSETREAFCNKYFASSEQLLWMFLDSSPSSRPSPATSPASSAVSLAVDALEQLPETHVLFKTVSMQMGMHTPEAGKRIAQLFQEIKLPARRQEQEKGNGGGGGLLGSPALSPSSSASPSSALLSLSSPSSSSSPVSTAATGGTASFDENGDEAVLLFNAVPFPRYKLIARLCGILLQLHAMFDTESWMKIIAHMTTHLFVPPAVHVAGLGMVPLTGTPSRVSAHLRTLVAGIDDKSFLQALVEFSLTHLTVVISSVTSDAPRHHAAQLLQLLFDANFSRLPPLLPHTLFYLPLSQEFELEDIKDDFIREHKGMFALMHYPCLLDAAYKSALMQIEAHVEYAGAMRNAMLTNMLNSSLQNNAQLSSGAYFLQLRIRRSDLVATTLKELQINISNLRKPLRITFEGEEGIDEGGLRKEFFQLLCKALLSPDHGMFQSTSDNRLWVVSDQKNDFNRREYWLIGMVIGLAVFNNIVLDVSFPMALFKKLLGLPIVFEDLASVDPELYQGLIALLAFEEKPEEGLTVEESFCRTFEYSEDIFGAPVSTELCPGGKDIPLTSANRQEYVRLLVDHILGRMIATNFGEFKKGFDQVCARGMIQQKMVRPEELELLVCGSPELDLKVLEETAAYDGFEEDDDTIRYFWEVVHGMSEENKRRFLKFCTGSDRVPVRGLADLKFVIGKNGDNQTMLPTAHTCFNHLLLPVYESKEVLESKLLLAIQNCEGFGLR